jgi:hypothetical protein
MPGDKEETALAIIKTGPIPTAMSDSLKEDPSPVVNTTEDDIAPTANTEQKTPVVDRAAAEEQGSIDSKNSNVQVRVSRRSTATGDSKESKRRFVIRWPTAKELGPGIHWYTPTMMVLLGLAGLFGGLGHHLYNAGLDGQPVIDAQWPQRWGVAMAFFVKMTLVGAVQMAVKQRAWVGSRSSYPPNTREEN